MAVFDVPDMHCDGCVKSITTAIRQAVPGADIRADLASHRVEITGAASPDAAAAAMRDAGFTPLLVAA